MRRRRRGPLSYKKWRGKWAGSPPFWPPQVELSFPSHQRVGGTELSPFPLLLLPVFCIMFIHLILLCFPSLLSLHSRVSRREPTVNPFPVCVGECCILLSQRGRERRELLSLHFRKKYLLRLECLAKIATECPIF